MQTHLEAACLVSKWTTGEWNSCISFNSVPVVHIGELSLGLGAEEQARWKIQEALWDSVNAL